MDEKEPAPEQALDEATRQDPGEVDEAEELANGDPDAMKAAMATLQMAMADPLRLATENAQLRDEIKGAYVVVKTLVRRMADPGLEVVLFREEMLAPPPGERLHSSNDDEGNLHLSIQAANRAERRRLSKRRG